MAVGDDPDQSTHPYRMKVFGCQARWGGNVEAEPETLVTPCETPRRIPRD